MVRAAPIRATSTSWPGGEQAQLLAAGRPVLAKRDYVRVQGRLSINTRPEARRNEGQLHSDHTKPSSTPRPLERQKVQWGRYCRWKRLQTLQPNHDCRPLHRGGLGGEDDGSEPLYNAEVDGSQSPTLAEVARQTRWEDDHAAEIKRQHIPFPITKKPATPTSTNLQKKTPSKTRVVNRRAHQAYDIYIGRGSKWGNPFKIGEEDGNREEVIEKYREWIVGQPHLMKALGELRGKILGCWCSPEACHGDVLIELLEKQQ